MAANAEFEIKPAQSIYGLGGDPLDYPSTLADTALYVDGSSATSLTWDWSKPEQIQDLGTSRPLRERSDRAAAAVDGLPARIPQIAFGANRDITNLAWKFANYQTRSGASADPFFVVPGVVPNARVVMCNIGYWGYIYSALLTDRGGDEVALRAVHGSAAPVAVLLLTSAQMRMVHESEGVPRPGEQARREVSCDVTLLDAQSLGASISCQLYGLPLPFLSFDTHSPVPFPVGSGSNLGARRRAQTLAWRRILEHPSIATFLREGERAVDDVVALLRRGSTVRSRDGAGEGGRSQDVYRHIRQSIIDELSLLKSDGSPLLPTEGLRSLAMSDRWDPEPTLADALSNRGSMCMPLADR